MQLLHIISIVLSCYYSWCSKSPSKIPSDEVSTPLYQVHTSINSDPAICEKNHMRTDHRCNLTVKHTFNWNWRNKITTPPKPTLPSNLAESSRERSCCPKMHTPTEDSYRHWVSPFTGPDPKVDGFRGRRLPRLPRPASWWHFSVVLSLGFGSYILPIDFQSSFRPPNHAVLCSEATAGRTLEPWGSSGIFSAFAGALKWKG